MLNETLQQVEVRAARAGMHQFTSSACSRQDAHGCCCRPSIRRLEGAYQCSERVAHSRPRGPARIAVTCSCPTFVDDRCRYTCRTASATRLRDTIHKHKSRRERRGLNDPDGIRTTAVSYRKFGCSQFRRQQIRQQRDWFSSDNALDDDPQAHRSRVRSGGRCMARPAPSDSGGCGGSGEGGKTPDGPHCPERAGCWEERHG